MQKQVEKKKATWQKMLEGPQLDGQIAWGQEAPPVPPDAKVTSHDITLDSLNSEAPVQNQASEALNSMTPTYGPFQNPKDYSQYDMKPYADTPVWLGGDRGPASAPIDISAMGPSLLPPKTSGTDELVNKYAPILEQHQQRAQASMGLQQADLDQLRKQISDYRGQQGIMDLTPTAATLEHYLPGSNLMKVAQEARGLSPDEKNEKVAGMQEKLAGLQGGLAKENLSALGENLRQMREEANANRWYAMANATQQRNTSKEMIAAQGQFNNSKIRNQYMPRLLGASNVLGLMRKMEDTSDPKRFIEYTAQVQKTIEQEIQALETGRNNSPQGTIEHQSYETAYQTLLAAKSRLFGTIQGLAPGDPNFKSAIRQFRALMMEQLGNYQHAVDDEMNMVAAQGTPAQKAVWQEKIWQMKKPFLDKNRDWDEYQRGAWGQEAVPKLVIQDKQGGLHQLPKTDEEYFEKTLKPQGYSILREE